MELPLIGSRLSARVRGRNSKSSSTRKLDARATIEIQIISECWLIICSQVPIQTPCFLEEAEAQSNK